MAILPQHALKGLNIPARGNAPGKGYIFPRSPERAIYKNKYMSRPFRADWLWGVKIPGRCPGLVCIALSGLIIE